MTTYKGKKTTYIISFQMWDNSIQNWGGMFETEKELTDSERYNLTKKAKVGIRIIGVKRK